MSTTAMRETTRAEAIAMLDVLDAFLDDLRAMVARHKQTLRVHAPGTRPAPLVCARCRLPVSDTEAITAGGQLVPTEYFHRACFDGDTIADREKKSDAG